jgi:hypothetical protein
MVNNNITRTRNPRKKPKKTPRKRDKFKGRGPEDEVPFLLKKRLEKQGTYEPGIVSEMLRDVTRNSVKAAMSRKRLMDSYKKYREEKKIEAAMSRKRLMDSYKKYREEKKIEADTMKKKFRENKRRIEEIDLLLNKPEIMQTDAPSRSTRSQTKLKVISINKSQPSNEYRKLISEKERLINENSSITYILNIRFPK